MVPPGTSNNVRRSVADMKFSGEDLICVRGGRVVFTGLEFALSPGDALLLNGPNGSGKTSLLRMMAGLTPKAAGTIGWHDGTIRDEPERHRARLHFIGNLDAMKPYLSVEENLSAWARPHGGDAASIATGLKTFGLGYLAGLPGRYLSTGQRRRLALARLTARPAILWLLDEPTIALDSAAIAMLYEAIAEHRTGGGMVVIATNVSLSLPDCEHVDLSAFASIDDGLYG
jgi:heme exporter protein A